ncbi:PREDICTED: GDSL esterase/lipase At2g03980-like [Nelumbo nucifera]|uniref:GDSL esterase/lipase At2g03980-like n=1 Tax=Nelumbo nucifera TaxID=4432 RepID=A0A1U7YUE0_NELNU|nr:PREDICTED: GDSL esterase/lipase At2g03980-like [Nelumbo nucifera]
MHVLQRVEESIAPFFFSLHDLDYLLILVAAEALGLPLVPPYLGLSEKERQEIRTGINYGSGSAGILPETGTILGPNLSLDTQLKLFTETVQKYLSNTFKGPNELSDHFSKSIFYINIGSNDFIYTYLNEPDLSNPRYKPTVLSNDLTERLSQNLQALYMLGARKFVVANLGLIGCIPYIVNRRKPKGVCVEELNQFVEVYNSKLIELLKGQSSTLPGSTFVTLKSYELSTLMASEESMTQGPVVLMLAMDPCHAPPT